ncbi:Oidioi.mRNA.OKI2018_I69.PAR.g11028.t1.cds [Oikopleura dioica]|uniref:Oidioi.mRNA.OKI2018_I69.PAR.g11028.t1.cds n=1 Tax=Oikopleura dioica TaxID=34765 RepID=A0ABN7RX80_OIKDI|nr:Oidioi.mRNA.OKI2018_I69.PAR.g11028.t1.cds [Oikopleura dioica]
MVQVEEITLSHVNEQLIRGAKSCAVNTTISPQIPLLAASDNRWADTVEELQFKIESIVDRLSRRRKFEGQVYLVGDVLGGLVCYDMINHLYDNVSKQETNSLQTAGNPVFSKRSSMDHPSISRSHSLRSERSQTSQASHSSTGSFEYGIDFAGLLLFNCPLAYMILQRKYSGMKVPPIHVPIFNLFYPIDQNAARLEPIFMQDECPNEPILLCRRDLSKPLFNTSIHTSRSGFDSLASTPTARRRRLVTGSLRSFFTRSTGAKKSSFDSTASSPGVSRQETRNSENSQQNTSSAENAVFHSNDKRRCHSSTGTVLSASDFASIDTGCPRIDYMLSCPDGLATMSSKCLPQYLYAAFWESADAASLLLKQAIYVESTHAGHANDEDTLNPHKTSTRWQRRRTTLKVRNLEPNHRAQDCITTEGSSPVISGRFSYGFFDVAMLTGEKVELQIRSDISESGWETIDSQDTDSNGRVSFTLPPGRFKSVALYHFRLNVTGDNSSCFCSLAIVPRQSKCVVFSIDSSFAGSVSILGTDPKVRPASVDVARFWNDNDYLILYISSRPDMMKNRVVSWLKQHNFPNGFTFFQKGIHHDPYAKKCEMLKKIISSSELDVAAAYGGPKDLQIYRSINIPTRSIFVVGSKGKNKIQNMGTVLSEGYNVHLDWLRNSPFQNLPQSANSASRLILKRQTTCLH